MGIEEKLPSGVMLTTVEGVIGWLRQASLWPATMGLACCAIEMMAFGAPRFDAGRWGQEVFRASPRQADLLITQALNELVAQAQEIVGGAEETPEAKVPRKQRHKATKPGEETAK